MTHDDGAGISPLKVDHVGGGTWSYGTELFSGWPPKLCFSNYKHNSRTHSSAVALGSVSVTRYAKAGYWASASARAGLAYTCRTFWDVY